ncbi:peptidoglycan-binding domain-containing protein [Archangium gephyra]|uniref:peptidoglycan-binding domain-containing protein n=1 Tax=Archangium gephyra TaxID=48 RepID=UPI003B7BECD7
MSGGTTRGQVTSQQGGADSGAGATSNYWEDENLSLSFTDKAHFSVDSAGARKHKQKANTPAEYVTQLQKDLVTLGYLSSVSKYREGLYEASTRRAVSRFQRHAARPYRLPGPDAQEPKKPDLSIPGLMKEGLRGAAVLPLANGPFKGPDTMFSGRRDGVCDHSTAKEVRNWISRGSKIPVGRFPLRAIRVIGAVGRLRQDAAEAWETIVEGVTKAGGTLEGAYGDTTRVLQKTTKSGTSRYSFHYCGRAVDINQALGGGKGQRYYAVQETVDQHTYWRIYCKTSLQDGTQGTKFTKGQVKCHLFATNKQYDIPAGYYIDLTEMIESAGTFERIKAQSGWEKTYNKTEWWHFQYKLDKQETFLDEMELIGFTEKQLREAGWETEEMLDHQPG